MKNKPELLAVTENWIAVNKPAGLLSVPDREQSEPSLKDLLRAQFGNIWVVHRLDKFTSGLIVFARTEEAHKYLSRQWEEHRVEKYYQGLVQGRPLLQEGTVEAGIMEHPSKKGTYITHRKGKPSRTDYKVLQYFGPYTWMEFRIHTGRTHQIRVHMKHIGHPIVCDEVYGTAAPVLLSNIKGKKFKLSQNEEAERPLLSRMALHAWKLQFTDADGSLVALEAPLPKDLLALKKQLEKWSST
ncbi:MAG: RluA family pseudouridine synthase [Lacibacter sp.]|jgi:23S rRNA pseudouridine955/2504/2580 synthase/23S rRNA pseudouridine1911/1915/1917 synthase